MVIEVTSAAAINAIKVFGLGIFTFLVAFFATPLLTNFLYKHKLWSKKEKTKSIDGKELEVIKKFHGGEGTSTPRLGGILVWSIPLVVIALIFLLSQTGWSFFEKANFLSRGQTWLPLFALVTASLLGLADDYLQTRGEGKYVGGGLSLKARIGTMALIGLIGGLWFYFKLGTNTIHIPGNGNFMIGFWYIPLFVIVNLAIYSGGVIDGLDGLSGGAFASMFAAFGVIAFFTNQINLAAFCFVILGALLAFLWFNIPPARFYMGESGIMGLCAVLTVVAFFTDSLLVLPIIAFLLVMESGSVIIQLLSKKFRGKKFFHAAPIHHHFEAKKWPSYKVTMRFWIIGVVTALIGVAIRLLG